MFRNKKGMEMWELVIMVLVIILLLVVIAWYAGLSKGLESFFERFGRIL